MHKKSVPESFTGELKRRSDRAVREIIKRGAIQAMKRYFGNAHFGVLSPKRIAALQKNIKTV